MTEQRCDPFGLVGFGEVIFVADGMCYQARIVGVWTNNCGGVVMDLSKTDNSLVSMGLTEYMWGKLGMVEGCRGYWIVNV
jgi:hypothetical protein